MRYGFKKIISKENGCRRQDSCSYQEGIQSRIQGRPKRAEQTSQLSENHQQTSLERALPIGQKRTKRGHLAIGVICREAGSRITEKTQRLCQGPQKKNQKFKPETEQAVKDFGASQRIQIAPLINESNFVTTRQNDQV